MLPTIDWQGDTIIMVDQRKLPGQEIYVRCRTAQEVARAIRTMIIRGAPAIGVSAAMGIALGMQRSTAKGTKQFAVEFQKTCDMMAATRPTAVNLFWAIDRMKRVFAEAAQAGQSTEEIASRLERESRLIHDEDVASCRTMGGFGADVVPDGARVLTHCNAGALATAGLRLGARRDPCRGGEGQEDRGLRRRDAPVSPGRALDGVGARPRGHRHDGHHREHGGPAHACRRNRPRGGRRRSHRRQRRHGQQDRHLHRRRAGARAQGSVLRRGAALDRRSRDAGRRHRFQSRNATAAR